MIARRKFLHFPCSGKALPPAFAAEQTANMPPCPGDRALLHNFQRTKPTYSP